LQLVVAASMVLLTLPTILRSLHEAVGVSVWLGAFSYAYLARTASRSARQAADSYAVPASRGSMGAAPQPVSSTLS
jgi:heme A synthase